MTVNFFFLKLMTAIRYHIFSKSKLNEAESYYFYLRYFDKISCLQFQFYVNQIKINFFYHPNFFGSRLESDQLLQETLRLYVEKAQFFTFPPYFVYLCHRNFFFLQIHETYCKKSLNSEFYENVYFVVWSMDNAKKDLFPQDLEQCGVHCLMKLIFNEITLLNCYM